MVGTTSAPQNPPVTITNTGSTALTITNIQASGDFSETNTCPASVPANGTCTISISFSPTASGARAGAITISDNAAGNPQSITLSGNGIDILITTPAGASTIATVTAGQTATFTTILSPAGGFNGPVTVSCSGTIPAATCTPTPNSFTLNSPTTVTTMVSTSKAGVVPGPQTFPLDGFRLRVLPQLLWLLAAMLVLGFAIRRRRRAWAAVAVSTLLVLYISGCAGGSNSPGPSGPTAGTPPSNYTLTLTVKTASGATRSITLTVIVQ
jgi:hypothetical protein